MIYFYLYFKKFSKKRSYNFPFSRCFSTVADTFVVLNFGLNHLMQHLYYQATKNPSQLTSKGDSSCMLISQDEILISTKEIIDGKKIKKIQYDEINRIVWLSRFCQGTNEKQRQTNIFARNIIKLSFS